MKISIGLLRLSRNWKIFLFAVINAVLRKNSHANVVINTITLQSLNEAINCMEKYKFENVEIVNVSVSKSKKIGRYDMMMGQNPIYIISGKGSGSN